MESRRSTDKRYSGDNRLISPERPQRRGGLAPRCRLVASWGWSKPLTALLMGNREVIIEPKTEKATRASVVVDPVGKTIPEAHCPGQMHWRSERPIERTASEYG